ncbi:division/cell wall cluster transcriptional repressor MraZ [Gaoshiqia sp. Z1-71]|uniref:division/cell wall cluster transcriptional repressor MraZ n=1 Tax=Gaoshiqia hydrogeniformans TaxID=3290090 RepID=UPI003BF92484
MDFSAEKSATVDEKGRVVLPADYKNEMGGGIPGGQLTIELDPYEKCLNIYPTEIWEKRLAFLKGKLNRNNREQSRLLDLIYRSFKIIQVPESCRMNLPNNFLEKVGIAKEVVFVGQGDRIRLWDAGEYEAYLGSMGGYGELFDKHFGNLEEL